MLSWMSNWVLCVKIVLISSGVVSLAMATKFVVPMMIHIAVYELPTLTSVLLLLFKPPYLYVIVNGIIITIAASSRFGAQSKPSTSVDQSRPLVSAKTPPSIQISDDLLVVEEEEEEIVDVKIPVVVNGLQAAENEKADVSKCTPQKISALETEMKTEILSPVPVKPPVLYRFGHRKPQKPTPPQGKKKINMRRSKEEEETDVTLDSVWKMITEGECQVKMEEEKRKKKKKSNDDVLENYNGVAKGNMINENHENRSTENKDVRKLETFKDRRSKCHHRHRDLTMKINYWLMSQDELNHRVEAFIHKFNHEMRLQKQESLNHYLEMINRGVN